MSALRVCVSRCPGACLSVGFSGSRFQEHSSLDRALLSLSLSPSPPEPAAVEELAMSGEGVGIMLYAFFNTRSQTRVRRTSDTLAVRSA